MSEALRPVATPPAPDSPPAVRIEAENEWAWCGPRRLTLTPRAFAVLRYLVTHPGRLVTKEELLNTVWRDAIVSDAALASGIRDLRRALRDSSATPRYIQTVHRRGFRFIGPVARAAPAAPSTLRPGSMLVGRETELACLHGRLGAALAGRRQLVFVTGEPGIGKTALVEGFLAEIGEPSAPRIGCGQCVERYGAGEAYLPILDALGCLGRAAGGDHLVQILKRHAPTWLAQLPGLLSDRDLKAVQRRAQGATHGRMLRELGDALDRLTQDAPLVLLLEDLHWSDAATIELLGMLARRRDPSRLLVLATYRPADVAAADAHPLRWMKPELQLHGYCDEIPLEFLTPADVAQYLARRLPGHELPGDVAPLLHRSTEGSPLFLVNTVEYLIGNGQLRETDGRWRLAGPVEDVTARVPETLGQLVDEQVERLPADEQVVLVAASVAGSEFSTAVVAVTAGIDARRAELRCEALARRGQFLRAAGVDEWPDGTVTARYAFIHTLYQHVLYGRVSIGARASLHLRAAERIEQGYGARAGEIAGELAVHFERGRDLERAVEYRGRAGEHALQQHAYREAAEHVGRALAALETLPASPGRAQRELGLRVTLGAALTATRGYAAPEVADAYARAWELCGEVGETPALLPVLRGVGRFYVVRGQFEIARDVGTQLLTLAKTGADPAPLLMAHNALGVASLWAGDFEGAVGHLDRGIGLHHAHERNPSPAVFRLVPPGVTCAIHAALALWALGYPDRSAARAREALALARLLGHPFSVSYACHIAAGLHQWRREPDPMQALEDEALAHDTEHGFGLLLAAGLVQRGWLLAEQGHGEAALDQMREGVSRHREVGAAALIPASLVMVAEAYRKLDRPADGLSAVIEGLTVARSCGQHYWEAELHRLAGVLTLESSADAGEAEAHLRRAIQVARRQRARSLELRAVTSLSRLLADQGKAGEARARLAEVYEWFTEGFDTADLIDARALLEELGEQAEQPPERNGDQQPA